MYVWNPNRSQLQALQAEQSRAFRGEFGEFVYHTDSRVKSTEAV